MILAAHMQDVRGGTYRIDVISSSLMITIKKLDAMRSRIATDGGMNED